MGTVYLFTFAFLCSVGIVAIWGAFERFLLSLIDARRAKKEKEFKREAAKLMMKEFCDRERDRILIKDTATWGRELEVIFKNRGKVRK